MKQKSVTPASDLVAIGTTSLLKGQRRLIGCQGCNASASRSFLSVLIEALEPNSPLAEYVLCKPARCPNCALPIIENTLVRCEDEIGYAAEKEFEPCWEKTRVVLINEAELCEAQSFITGCEYCDKTAEITFDYILDEVTGCDPTITEYLLCRSAKCNRCQHDVSEKTLVAN